MKSTIETHLVELEQKQGFKILLAVESGSRGWGFPSPDSDFDVRIIYVRPRDWYLSVQDRRDTIEYLHGELLDISGWDIIKTLRLLRKSNVSPYEWMQSPITYKQDVLRISDLRSLGMTYFNPAHAFNHYRGITKNSIEQHLSGTRIGIKKLFYILRPLLAAKWTAEKGQIAPMMMVNLLTQIDDSSIVDEVHKIIEIKKHANEGELYSISSGLREFVLEEFALLETAIFDERHPQPDVEPLNNYFRKLLDDYDTLFNHS